jgi:hypothetical protein
VKDYESVQPAAVSTQIDAIARDVHERLAAKHRARERACPFQEAIRPSERHPRDPPRR